MIITHTEKKLLASTKECPNCSTQGNSQPMSRKSIGIREGTFFQQTRISLQKWLILIYWWVREYAVTDAMEEAEVSKHVAIDVYHAVAEGSMLNKANIPKYTIGGAWPHRTNRLKSFSPQTKGKEAHNFVYSIFIFCLQS